MSATVKKMVGFSRKVFWSIFLSCLGILIVSLLSASQIFSNWILEEYQDRYSTLSSIISDNIREMETSAEKTMLNAALFVRKLDEKGVLATEELKSIAKQTNVTHIFVINSKGKFIRSTNEDPSLIPNLFSFCAKYPSFLTTPGSMDVTPIIQPTPEPSPYKFLIIPSASGERFISVGLRVDFLSNSLKRFQQQDSAVESIEMYSPKGTLLGQFKANEVNLLGSALQNIPSPDRQLIETNEALIYSSWTPSSHQQCCQCQTAGDVRDGNYDYLLRMQVSKDGLIKAQSNLLIVLALLALFSVIVSALFARIISVKLVARLQSLNKQVKENLKQSDKIKPLKNSGSDELTELGQSFNKLIHQREEYRKKNIKLERIKRKQELADVAAQVSHDIQSPLMTLLKLSRSSNSSHSKDHKRLLQSATTRLQTMTNELLKKYRGEELNISFEPANLSSSIYQVAEEKRVEYGSYAPFYININMNKEVRDKNVLLSESELSRILSNLINNSKEAVESSSEKKSLIKASLSKDSKFAVVSIIDTGKGIPHDVLKLIRLQGGSFNKENGCGLGLTHARKALDKIGGRLAIYSEENGGTRVTLRIPIERKMTDIQLGSEIILIDNDPIMRKIWQLEAEDLGVKFKTAANKEEINFRGVAKDAQIYVDLNLDDKSCGLEICEWLYKQGFKHIFLTTADSRVKAPPYVTVVGKEFPLSEKEFKPISKSNPPTTIRRP